MYEDIYQDTLQIKIANERGVSYLVGLAELLALHLVGDEEVNVQEVTVFQWALRRGCPHHGQRQGRPGSQSKDEQAYR
jgi:hypothetical protein